MSFYRNLTLFRFSPDVATDLASLPEAVSSHRLRGVGPMELATRGFVSPFGRNEDALTNSVGKFTAIVVGEESKILPPAVVNDEVFRRVSKVAADEGRKVGGRERGRIKDDVLNELLPRAFARSGRVAAYFDHDNGWLVVDAATRSVAEAVVTQIREALGSFPAVPLAPEESPRALLTDWLATGELPAGFELGDECELRDPATSTGAVVRARRQYMESEEVREHLRNGKQVFRLGLTFDQRLTFVLGEDLVVRKLKFLDIVLDQADEGSFETMAAEMSARLALQGLELQRLLGHLESIFNLPRPE